MRIDRKDPMAARLLEAAEAVGEASKAQRRHAQRLEAGDALVASGKAFDPHLDFAQALLRAERDDPDSPIDFDALPNLQRATEAQIERAWARSSGLRDAARALHQLARFGPELMRESVADVPARRATAEVGVRERLADDLSALLELANGSEDLAAVIPRGDLEALRARARQDIRDLAAAHGSHLLLGPKARARLEGTKRLAGRIPRPERLPPSRRLAPEAVASAESAARALAHTLDKPELEPTLRAVRQKVPERDRATFDRALGAFALLADEATTAPDYTTAKVGARDRSSYRARRAAGASSRPRQRASAKGLGRALAKVGRAKDPLAALQASLSKELTRELGVPAHEAEGWAPTVDAMHAALADEAFVPLRALTERAARAMRVTHGVPEATTNRVVFDLVRSVLEGRYLDWRANNAGSAAQLAHLDPVAKAAWLAPIRIEHTFETEQGPVTVASQEATEGRGHEVFWSTKIGGMSHAFDTMTQCALAAYSNTRNQVLMANDPRWPTQAGRAYLRLAEDPATGGPIMYLEGLKADAPYDGDPAPLERVLVEHALKKAAAMGAKLTLSQNLLGQVRALDLPGEWRTDQVYGLAPALLVEAASVYGAHDWVATEPEQRTMRDPQFHVDVAAWVAARG